MPSRKLPPPPTAPQLAALRKAEAYRASRDHAPSMREVARALPMAHTTLREHLRNLADLGWVQLTKERPGWKLLFPLPETSESVSVRLSGRIAAGQPIEAIEEQDRLVELPNLLAPGDEYYYLRVIGNSMVDDHICDGDLILCRRQASVDPGEIAVCLVKNTWATLKRVFAEKGKVRLQPASSEHTAQVYRAGEVEVQGKYVALIRIPG